MRTHAKPSALSLFERSLAGFTTCTIIGDPEEVSRLGRQLAELGAPRWLLDNVQLTRGRWSVCDDDRLDAIVGYAASVTRGPGRVEDTDVDRLRSVGLSDFDIADVNNVIAYYNANS